MLARTIAVALGVFGAFGASQLPELAQQYRQRLGGAVDELGAIVQRFDSEAARLNLTRDQGLAQLRQAQDAFSRQRAEAEADTIRRHEKLKLHREVMAGSAPFVRMASLLAEGDSALMDRTMADFEPAMPVTAEGATLAAGGFTGFYALTRLFLGLCAAPFRRRRAANESA
jgi:hypothetical protein